jgi:RNA-directed DNA polymerase
METAWASVMRAGDKAPGVDRKGVQESRRWYLQHEDQIRTSIRNGQWQPKPVRRVFIPKASGGDRPLGIPTVIDRVTQRSIMQVLTPMVDPGFSGSSHGFRPGRSVYGAARQVLETSEKGYGWAVDFDLSRFFDTVNHGLLCKQLRDLVPDSGVVKLIEKYLTAGVLVDGTLQPTVVGVPQGGPASGLLANINLDPLDKYLAARGHPFVRYADDFVVLVRSRKAAKRVLENVRRFLEKELKLQVNVAKTRVTPVNDCVFLGFKFQNGRIGISDKAYEAFKGAVERKLAACERRPDSGPENLVLYLNGWLAHYGRLRGSDELRRLTVWLQEQVNVSLVRGWINRSMADTLLRIWQGIKRQPRGIRPPLDIPMTGRRSQSHGQARQSAPATVAAAIPAAPMR